MIEGIKQYDPYIQEASARFGVSVEKIRAIIATESKGVPTASSGSAFGLMQVTMGTWKYVQQHHPELAQYDFSEWTDPRVNILFGTATLKDKTGLIGVDGSNPHFAELAVTAYNAGEGTVLQAMQNARHAGSKDPAADCMKPEFLKPAIRKTGIYKYYLTGQGKKMNPHASDPTSEEAIATAVDLKYNEVSKYPGIVKQYLEVQKDEKAPGASKSEPDGGGMS